MRRRVGAGHPHALACAAGLANSMAGVARHAEALALALALALKQDTLPHLTEQLGPRHPDTLACQANLAVSPPERPAHAPGKPGSRRSAP